MQTHRLRQIRRTSPWEKRSSRDKFAEDAAKLCTWSFGPGDAPFALNLAATSVRLLGNIVIRLDYFGVAAYRSLVPISAVFPNTRFGDPELRYVLY